MLPEKPYVNTEQQLIELAKLIENGKRSFRAIEPLDCSACRMELRCDRTKEVCKYPEGRLYGVVHRRISELESLRSRVSELEAALERINGHLAALRINVDDNIRIEKFYRHNLMLNINSAIRYAAEALRGKK